MPLLLPRVLRRGRNVEEVQRLLLAHKKLLTYRLSGREGARIHGEQWGR